MCVCVCVCVRLCVYVCVQGVQAVKRLLRLQSRLPSSAVCTVQPALRVWYARVKHLSLGVVFNESQGSDLSLLHLYAKL